MVWEKKLPLCTPRLRQNWNVFFLNFIYKFIMKSIFMYKAIIAQAQYWFFHSINNAPFILHKLYICNFAGSISMAKNKMNKSYGFPTWRKNTICVVMRRLKFMPQPFKNQFPGNQYSVSTRLKTVKFMQQTHSKTFFLSGFPPRRKLMFPQKNPLIFVLSLFFLNTKLWFRILKIRIRIQPSKPWFRIKWNMRIRHIWNMDSDTCT